MKPFVLLLCLIATLCVAKDARKFTDKDWQRLEEQWLADEEDDEDSPFTVQKDESGRAKLTPDGRKVKVPKANRPKVEMVFVSLNVKSKKDTEGIAFKWTDLFKSAAVGVKIYAIEDTKVLVVVEGGAPMMDKVKSFVLDQEETEVMEWNQQKYYPKRTKQDL